MRAQRQQLVTARSPTSIARRRATCRRPRSRWSASSGCGSSAEALQRLKPQELRALWLKAEGFSYAEICEQTGWTHTKVNRCITEGRRAFMARYARIDGGDECERWLPLLSAIVDGEATPEQLARDPPAPAQLRARAARRCASCTRRRRRSPRCSRSRSRRPRRTGASARPLVRLGCDDAIGRRRAQAPGGDRGGVGRQARGGRGVGGGDRRRRRRRGGHVRDAARPSRAARAPGRPGGDPHRRDAGARDGGGRDHRRRRPRPRATAAIHRTAPREGAPSSTPRRVRRFRAPSAGPPRRSSARAARSRRPPGANSRRSSEAEHRKPGSVRHRLRRMAVLPSGGPPTFTRSPALNPTPGARDAALLHRTPGRDSRHRRIRRPRGAAAAARRGRPRVGR